MCITFHHALSVSETCTRTGIKIGRNVCVPEEHKDTIIMKPPTEHPNSLVPIYVQIEEVEVVGIDTRSNKLSVSMSLSLSWNDNRLKLKKLEVEENYFDIFKEGCEVIYFPKFRLHHSLDQPLDVLNNNIFGQREECCGMMREVYPNNDLVMKKNRFRVTVDCNMKDSLKKFPFDSHTCKLEVRSSYFPHFL